MSKAYDNARELDYIEFDSSNNKINFTLGISSNSAVIGGSDDFARVHSNSSFDHANSSFIHANAGFEAANTITLNKIYENDTRVQVTDSNTADSNVVFVVNDTTCANISESNVTITLATAATAVNTGALQVHGGASIAGDFFVGNSVYVIEDVISSYSDIRLKTKTKDVTNPLDIVNSLTGFYYTSNELAQQFIKQDDNEMIGLSAQDVQKVLPSVVTLASFDTHLDADGKEVSKSGENYLTVNYARIVPILIEAIKEQQKEIEMLKEKVNGIYSRG